MFKLVKALQMVCFLRFVTKVINWQTLKNIDFNNCTLIKRK